MTKYFWSFFAIVFLLAQQALAQDIRFARGIPDNSSARRLTYQSYIVAPLTSLKVGQASLLDDPLLQQPVRVEVSRPDPSRGLLISYVGRVGQAWDAQAPGTVLIERSKTGIQVDAVTMVLAPQAQVRAIIRPRGVDSVSLTVQILGIDFEPWKDVRFAIPLSSFLLMPVHRMMELTQGRIQWGEVIWHGDAKVFSPQQELMSRIRPILKRLPDAEDGALDENGRLVKIATGSLATLPGFNCSGFAKWLVDGFYYPLVKAQGNVRAPYLPIADLKQRHIDHRGNERTLPWEELRDPYFGLDWIRNLATILGGMRGEQVTGPEARDLRDGRGESYVEDKGYRSEKIPLVMYLAAIKNPQRWYLMSINGEFGTSPVLWQHYHIAAVFPYFDESGGFQLSVFERNVETSWQSLLRRYPRTYSHPVWLNILGDFEPLSF